MTANIIERILKNQIYLGKLPNKSTGEVFDGQHPAIITQELFDAVQQKLTDNNNHKGRTRYCRDGQLFHNMIYTADGMVFKKNWEQRITTIQILQMRNNIFGSRDFDAIVCDSVRDFLNSDMGQLPDTTRLTLKQLGYSNELASALIDRIVYHEHKLTIFINIADLDKLGAFRKDNYINTNATPMEYCQSPDGKQVIIEQVVCLSCHTCINHRNAVCSRDLLTKTENATMLIKVLAYG